jgi:hypothetical protein
MEEGESLVGVTVVVVVLVVVVVVMVVLLSHESLAEETTTTTTLPNYQPLPPPFFLSFSFFWFVFSNLSQTNPKTYANLKLHNLPQIDPKLNANFKNCTICHRQTQKLMQILKLHNLPQINPKLNANFKNCTICHRQTQNLMQISKNYPIFHRQTQNSCKFQNCTIFHRQTQNLRNFKTHLQTRRKNCFSWNRIFFWHGRTDLADENLCSLHVSKQSPFKFTPFCKSLAEKLLGSFFFFWQLAWKQASKQACPKLYIIL